MSKEIDNNNEISFGIIRMWKEIVNLLQQLVGIGYVDQKVKGSKDYEGRGHQGSFSC